MNHCKITFPALATVLSLAGLLLMQGCASMSSKECLTANWYDQGYRDGRGGYPLSRIEDHRKACASVHVVPDMQRYQAGHEKGLVLYCTPENAIDEGRAGHPYRRACPALLEEEFLYYYGLGKDVYDAQRKIDSLNRDSKRLQYQLDHKKEHDERRDLRRELRSIDRRLRSARDDLRHAQRRANRY